MGDDKMVYESKNPEETTQNTRPRRKKTQDSHSVPKYDGKPAYEKKNRTRRVIEGITSVVLIAVFVGVGYWIFGDMTEIVQDDAEVPEYVAETDANGEIVENTSAEGTVFENIAIDNAQMYAGDLILVNNEYAYTEMDMEEITSIYEYKEANDISYYYVSGSDTSLRSIVLEAMTEMLSDFYVATGHADIIILSGYRSTEAQQELYDADLEATGSDTSDLVALPGHSEHETGYSFDVSLYIDGAVTDYDGTGDYEWIDENCDHYGLILRYPSDKSDITEIQSEEWHYRYVGQPHATYMTENNLCLEEYITFLKDYTSDNPLEIVNWDGEIYQAYYIAADTTSDSTYVLVPPDLDYTISGNNVDGFIITVDTGEIASHSETMTTESDSDSTNSDSDEETTETDDETAEDDEQTE